MGLFIMDHLGTMKKCLGKNARGTIAQRCDRSFAHLLTADSLEEVESTK